LFTVLGCTVREEIQPEKGKESEEIRQDFHVQFVSCGNNIAGRGPDPGVVVRQQSGNAGVLSCPLARMAEALGYPLATLDGELSRAGGTTCRFLTP